MFSIYIARCLLTGMFGFRFCQFKSFLEIFLATSGAFIRLNLNLHGASTHRYLKLCMCQLGTKIITFIYKTPTILHMLMLVEMFGNFLFDIAGKKL